MIRLTIANIIIYEKNNAFINDYFDYVMICMIMIYSRRYPQYKTNEDFNLKDKLKK